MISPVSEADYSQYFSALMQGDHALCLAIARSLLSSDYTIFDLYEQLFKRSPTLTTWPFSTNGVAIMGKHNIPVIGYGPGVIAACHVSNEYVEKEQVLRAAMMYAAMCVTYTQAKQ